MSRHQACHRASSPWRASQAASVSRYTSGSRLATDITQVNGRSGVTVTAVGCPGWMAAVGVVRSATASVDQLQTRTSPRCSARGARRRSPESRVEGDDGLDRAVGGGESAHQHGGGEQAPADLGHHALGEGQPTGVGLPGRLEGGGVGAVAASHYLGGVCGGKSEASRGRSADQLAEYRLTVEARDAQPVDRTVGADQRGRAGVAEQSVVLDRGPHRGAGLIARRGGDPGRCRRQGGRRGSPGVSACRS